MSDRQAVVLSKGNELERLGLPGALAMTIDSPNDQISIMQFWRVLQKRRWLVLGSLAFVVLLAMAFSLILPKRYDASARLLLDLDGNDDLSLERVVMPMGLDLNTKLETQIRIVESNTTAISVIKQLGLHHKKDFAGRRTVPPDRDFDNVDLKTRAKLTEAFHKSLGVKLIPKIRLSKFISAAKIRGWPRRFRMPWPLPISSTTSRRNIGDPANFRLVDQAARRPQKACRGFTGKTDRLPKADRDPRYRRNPQHHPRQAGRAQ